MIILQKITKFSTMLTGVFLEYFDYTLYGFSAPYIAHEFFPSSKPAIELLLAWSVFAISFLVRPIGAVVFGHLADRYGRRHILIFAILLMSISTIAIGCLPTYQYMGMVAPISLLVCRILQGLAVSTEYSGCSTYLLEFKKARKGLISGIITSASGFGVFSASALVLCFNSTNQTFYLIENWRWPFIIAGLVICIVGFWSRLRLVESPDFLALKQQNSTLRFPLWHLLKTSPGTLIKAIIISAYVGISIILLEIYFPTYLQTHLHFLKKTALQLSTFLALIEACFAIFLGSISDAFGPQKTIVVGGIMMLVGVLPLVALFSTHTLIFCYLAAAGLAFIVAAGDGPIAAYLVSCFPTQFRYTGVSISYNLGAAIFGGLSPSILILFQYKFPLKKLFAYYLIIVAITMLVCVGFSKIRLANHSLLQD